MQFDAIFDRTNIRECFLGVGKKIKPYKLENGCHHKGSVIVNLVCPCLEIFV